MSYLNSVTIIGFVGADPEQRQARNNNGSKFTVLSVATHRSWKNTDDEWASKTEWHRVCVFRPRLAEYVATIKETAALRMASRWGRGRWLALAELRARHPCESRMQRA
jgi:single-stranded DNA-binding protein